MRSPRNSTPTGWSPAWRPMRARGDVLMVAHMNAEALQRTIETGEAWYFSRSRQSALAQGRELRPRPARRRDARRLRPGCGVDQGRAGGPGACHTGRRSCFYRAVPLGKARRGDARIPRRRQDVRSEGGLRQEVARLTTPRRSRAREQLLRAARCGRSYITPSMPTAPAPGCCREGGDHGARLGERCRGRREHLVDDRRPAPDGSPSCR